MVLHEVLPVLQLIEEALESERYTSNTVIILCWHLIDSLGEGGGGGGGGRRMEGKGRRKERGRRRKRQERMRKQGEKRESERSKKKTVRWDVEVKDEQRQ